MLTPRSFDAASHTYDDYAWIQRITADTVANHPLPAPPRRILDVGCGTGILTQKMAQKYPQSHIDAIDPSPNMSARCHGRGLPRVRVVTMALNDMDPSPQYDYVVSNAALQWTPMADSFRHIRDLLQPQGVFYAAIYGRHTAVEWDRVLQDVGRPCVRPAHRFLTHDDLRQLGGAYWPHWSVTTTRITQTFPSVIAALKSQKYTGVTQKATQNGLWTPRLITRLTEAFHRHYGAIQISYEIHYAQGINP